MTESQLTREDVQLLHGQLEILRDIFAGRAFTIEGINARFRTALLPEQVLQDYEALGKKLGIDPALLPSILVAVGGLVLAEAVKLHERVVVPDGATLN